MLRRMIVPLLFGIAGCALLIALGCWQLRRLEWKEGILSRIEARIAAAPVAVPAQPDPEADGFLPVRVSGRFTGAELDVLVSDPGRGAGYRIIGTFEAEDGRRLMVDRGFIPSDAKEAVRPGGAAAVTGNLHWPEETDSFTPAPERDGNIWFARDVPAMAEALGTEPVLVVARQVEGTTEGITPVAVGTKGIPNDHLEYAITWFALTLIWAGMTGLLLWRIRQRARQAEG